jgi:hypothetical protein
MQDDLAAEVARLNLPANTADYSKEDWARHSAVTNAWCEKQNEPPLGGGVQTSDLTAGSPTFGETSVYTTEEYDLDCAFDQAPPGSAEAIAIAAKLAAMSARATAPPAPVLHVTSERIRAPRREAMGVRRRTCTGGRPSARRSSRSSSGDSSEGPSDPPEYRHADLAPFPLVGSSARLLSDSLARVGVVA